VQLDFQHNMRLHTTNLFLL